MAISPSEANKLSEVELIEVEKFEVETDNKLRKGERLFYHDFKSEKAKQEFINRYEAVGWVVKYHYDQRDGGYWKFTEKVDQKPIREDWERW